MKMKLIWLIWNDGNPLFPCRTQPFIRFLSSHGPG